MTVLEICCFALNFHGKPATNIEIESLAKTLKIIESDRKLSNSISSRISEDIRKKKSNSIFARFDRGTYGLRKWLNNSSFKEYQPERREHDKMSEILAVFPRIHLSDFVNGSGIFLNSLSQKPFEEICEPMVRREAELTYEKIQLVSCFAIRFNDELLCFQRSKKLPEKRLSNVKSLHFGGHIEFSEINGLFDSFNPLSEIPWIERELKEELNINDEYQMTDIGYIHDSDNDLGRQHIGLFYDVSLSSKHVSLNEVKNFYNLNFINIKNLSKVIGDYDSWSRYIIEYYLERGF